MFEIQINDAPPLSIASISLSDSSGLPNHAPPVKVLKSTPLPSLTGFFTLIGLAVFIGAAAEVGTAFFSNERLPKNLISGTLFLGPSLSIAAIAGDDDEGTSFAGGGVDVLGTPPASVSILNNGAPTKIYSNRKFV